MTVAFDAFTEPATFTTTSPYTFDHTPSGTPRGIVLEIDHGTTASDLIDGTVSYGGVAMERVGSPSVGGAEPGRSYLYFLGEGIPTGTQTVSISHTGSADVKHTIVASVTAASDTEIGAAGGDNTIANNPQVTLGRYIEGLGFVVAYHSTGAPSTLVPIAGMSAIESHDFGNFVSRFDRETTASAAAFPIGYTLGSTAAPAMVAISVQEVGSGCYPAGAMTPVITINPTTTFDVFMAGQLDGVDLYAFAISRDHTSGTAQATCTDDSGVGSWALVSNDADRKLNVWWKRGTTADISATVTIAGCVGSSKGGVVVVKGGNGAGGDPTTNLSVETNASGDETHTGMTPDNDNSTVMFSVMDYGNDTNPATSIAGATMGSLEPELFDLLSTGGSDCRINVTGRPLASGATGDITWSQTDSTTKSVLFAVAPGVAGITGTGASTLDDVASDGTGVQSMLATGASTLDDVTSDGTGTIVNPISGTGASTLDGASSAGTGIETFLGTGSSTLDGVASAGSGVVANPITGTGSSTLDGVTSSGSGVLGIIASGSSSLDGVVSQGSGIVANPITGTGSSVLDDVTSSGSGETTAAGHIENVVCDMLGPLGDCGELGPEGACTIHGPLGGCDEYGLTGSCDSIGPLCVGTLSQ